MDAGKKKILALIILSSILLLFLHILNISMIRPRNDAQQYLSYAYNLLKHGVYSKQEHGKKPLPDNDREPGQPLFLATSIMLHPDVDVSKDSMRCVAFGMKSCHEKISYLKIPGLVLMVASAAIMAVFVFQITGRMWTGLLCFFLIGFSQSYGFACDRFYSETLAGFLLTVFSFLLAGYGSKRIHMKIFTGTVLALLILTRAVFLYLVPFVIIIFIIFRLRQKIRLAVVLREVLILILPVVIIVGSWMVRNHNVENTYKISSRGGLVLMVRSYMNEMLADHYMPAVGYYAGGYWKRQVMENEPAEVLSMFRNIRENGFKGAGIRHARRIRKRLLKDRGKWKHVPREKMARFYGAILDSEVSREAWQRLFSQWPDHLAMMVPVALRGIGVEKGLGFREHPKSLGTIGKKHLGFDTGWLKLDFPWWFNYLLFFSLFCVFVTGIIGRDVKLFWLCLPAFYSFCVHTAMTHFIPRYSVPALPVLYGCFCIVLYWLYRNSAPKIMTVLSKKKRSPEA